MATIGIDAEILLDANGYYIKPETYKMAQARIRKATVRADGGESYVDLGPGKRVWSMTILCLNELVRYDGAPTGKNGQQYRDALRTSYTSSIGTTITYSDPINAPGVPVHFDHYAEHILDLHSQVIAVATGSSLAASYEVDIILAEA